MSLVLCRQRGLFRRSMVIDFIAVRRSLSREQVQLVAFGDSDYMRWKCRVELKRFVDARVLRRGRCAVTNDYVYWRGRRPDDLDHLIQVNWVWLTLRLTGRLDRFDSEVNCGNTLIADAFFVVGGKPYFLEFHREVNRNRFDKVSKYTAYFESGVWDTPDWPLPGKFARILVVVETEKDADRIRKIIERDNNIGLRFIVATLGQVKEDVGKCLLAGTSQKN